MPKLPAAIKSKHEEIAALRNEVQKKLRSKRNLAHIIYNDWKAGELLLKFAKLVVNGAVDVEKRTAIVQSCEDFIKVFDNCKDTIFEKCKQEIGITLPFNISTLFVYQFYFCIFIGKSTLVLFSYIFKIFPFFDEFFEYLAICFRRK